MAHSRVLLGFTFLGTTVAAVLALFWFWNKKDQDEPDQTRETDSRSLGNESSRTQNGSAQRSVHRSGSRDNSTGSGNRDPEAPDDPVFDDEIEGNGTVNQATQIRSSGVFVGSKIRSNGLEHVGQTSKLLLPELNSSRDEKAADLSRDSGIEKVDSNETSPGLVHTALDPSETESFSAHPIVEAVDRAEGNNHKDRPSGETVTVVPVSTTCASSHTCIQTPQTCVTDHRAGEGNYSDVDTSDEESGLETDVGPSRNRDLSHIWREKQSSGDKIASKYSRTLTASAPSLQINNNGQAETSSSVSGLGISQTASSEQTVYLQSEAEAIPEDASTNNDLSQSVCKPNEIDSLLSQNSANLTDVDNAALKTGSRNPESVSHQEHVTFCGQNELPSAKSLVGVAAQGDDFAEMCPSESQAPHDKEQICETHSQSSTEISNKDTESSCSVLEATPIQTLSINNLVSCETKTADLESEKDGNVIESHNDLTSPIPSEHEEAVQTSDEISDLEELKTKHPIEHDEHLQELCCDSLVSKSSDDEIARLDGESEKMAASASCKHLSDLANSAAASISLDSLEQSPEPESRTETEEQEQNEVGLSTSSTISDSDSLLESGKQPSTSDTVDVLNADDSTETTTSAQAQVELNLQRLPEEGLNLKDEVETQKTREIAKNCDIESVLVEGTDRDINASAIQTCDVREGSQSTESCQSRDSLEPLDVTDTSTLTDLTNGDLAVDGDDSGVVLRVPGSDVQSKGSTQSHEKSETSAVGSGYNCDNTSEASNDSGKGASVSETVSLPQQQEQEFTICELDFPSDLCGRLIGRRGKNINYIKDQSGATVTLRNNPYTPEFQICSIEGLPVEIEEALKLIRQKFPKSQYPNVQLSPNNGGSHDAPVILSDVMQMNLPHGVSVDVMVSSIVNAGHIFLQQLTHPTFPSLERLNQFMSACYTQDHAVPQLPRPIESGVICAAPMMNGWYRAQVVDLQDETDEVDVKFVDYGGYSRLPSTHLRQIRSDFMTLPFQAVECYMANVTTNQGEMYFNGDGTAVLEELTQGKLLQAQVVGRAEDGVPFVHIYQVSGNKALFVNREMVNRGVARWIEQL